jgi:hypothetical protein
VPGFPTAPGPVLPGCPGSGCPGSTSSTAPQGAVLGAGLRRVLEITETALGNVQLAEVGLLRPEKHSGLGRQFTDFFAFASTTPAPHARRPPVTAGR